MSSPSTSGVADRNYGLRLRRVLAHGYFNAGHPTPAARAADDWMQLMDRLKDAYNGILDEIEEILANAQPWDLCAMMTGDVMDRMEVYKRLDIPLRIIPTLDAVIRVFQEIIDAYTGFHPDAQVDIKK